MADFEQLKSMQDSFHEKDSFLIHVLDKKRPGRKLDVELRVHTEKYINSADGISCFEIRVDQVRVSSVDSEDSSIQYCNLPVMEVKCEATTWSQLVSFSNGYVVVDPYQLQGLHIGTYIFNMLVEWARENFPDYGVMPITLGVVQSFDSENKIRRNKFYDNFGFRIAYIDDKHAIGSSPEDLLVSQLNTRNTWKDNIVII